MMARKSRLVSGALRAAALAAFATATLTQPAAENYRTRAEAGPIIVPSPAATQHASGGSMLVPKKVRLIIRYVSTALA